MTDTSWTPAPSSVKRRTPNEASSPMGARCSPARPMVMAPATATWHIAPVPSESTSSATAALSTGGSVLGMATTAVNPPSAAARAPLSTVSASSAPGWRRWVCRSTSPGATRHPPASSTVAPRGTDTSPPTSTTWPSLMTTSAARDPVPSTTVPPRITM